MFRSLLRKIRRGPVAWRLRLFHYRLSGAKDNLVLFAILGLPVSALAFFAHFAYSSQLRINAARQRAIDLHCLAENIYFEARGEPLDGQYAVADVTLNRLASPHFPDTICEVVHDTRWDPLRRRFVAHFSWTQMEPGPKPAGPAWQEAMAVATAAYDEARVPVVPDALFYHATAIRPYWARPRRVVATIGNHVFYR